MPEPVYVGNPNTYNPGSYSYSPMRLDQFTSGLDPAILEKLNALKIARGTPELQERSREFDVTSQLDRERQQAQLDLLRQQLMNARLQVSPLASGLLDDIEQRRSGSGFRTNSMGGYPVFRWGNETSEPVHIQPRTFRY